MSNYVSPEGNKLFWEQSLRYYEKEQVNATEPYYKYLCGKEIEEITTKLKELAKCGVMNTQVIQI